MPSRIERWEVISQDHQNDQDYLIPARMATKISSDGKRLKKKEEASKKEEGSKRRFSKKGEKKKKGDLDIRRIY